MNDEEVLNSIPDDAIVGTLAQALQRAAEEEMFGLQRDDGTTVAIEVGKIDISPMKVASFSFTAKLGAERRIWAVRIEAHE